MRQVSVMSNRAKHRAMPLAVLLLLGTCSGLLLAATKIGLPYVDVPSGPAEDQKWQHDVEIYADSVTIEEGFVEIAADPVNEWEERDVEIAATPIDEQEERDVEIAADPVIALKMVEVAPDPYSRGYRSGIDVYRYLPEHSFDNEPMLVVYAKADPAMALPDVVVTPASIDQRYNHITAAQQIDDPIARGEDKIFLQLSELPDAPGRPSSTPPKQRRFFSQGSDL